ncbi:MAG: OmpA family protein [Myxococcales bacterium]|nr:OmpA family protein [Myxococcales bacterium]USN51484.1 MAG: OmpA family protein [Myxococcales bacterium]
MSMYRKKTLYIGLIAFVVSTLFSGCQKKLQPGMCIKDRDCVVDASGKTLNGVCIEQQCQECREDIDCTGLNQCINNRCEQLCQADTDCGYEKHCEDSICVNNCSESVACLEDQTCSNGRCVSQLDLESQQDQLTLEGCKKIERIQFDFNRFEIKEDYRSDVQKLAQCLEKHPTLTLSIKGHTDERGTPAYNMALGDKRARAVLSFLQGMGIATARVTTLSLGETEPLVKESNEYAWQQNRRAEFNWDNN